MLWVANVKFFLKFGNQNRDAQSIVSKKNYKKLSKFNLNFGCRVENF